jgi:hypothetical protein
MPLAHDFGSAGVMQRQRPETIALPGCKSIGLENGFQYQ